MPLPATAVREIRQEELKIQSETFEAKHTYMLATIKEVAGSTVSPTQYNMTWVSMWNQPESAVLVYNNTTLGVAGTPVWIGPQMQPPWRNEIKGVYTGEVVYSAAEYTTALSVPPHGPIHQVPSNADPGADPVFIYSPQLMMLRTTGNGSNMTVTVRAAKYIRGDRTVEFLANEIDLTSSIPASGYTRLVLIYLDQNTNTAEIVDGGLVLTDSPSPPPAPAIPDGGCPSALVTVSSGQTYVSTTDHVVDTRSFLQAHYDSLNAILSLPTPSADGQMLVSQDGQWVETQLVTAEDDTILIGEDGNVVYGE